jgi:hypothetical protein
MDLIKKGFRQNLPESLCVLLRPRPESQELPDARVIF